MFSVPENRCDYPSAIDEAPRKNGVYGIFLAGGTCLYVGMSDALTTSIRTRLRDHTTSDDKASQCIQEHISAQEWYPWMAAAGLYALWETDLEILTRHRMSVKGREKHLIARYREKNPPEAECNTA